MRILQRGRWARAFRRSPDVAQSRQGAIVSAYTETLSALRMPARVDRMPLSWYSPIRGRDVAIGFRVWNGPHLKYGDAVALVERRERRYVVALRDFASGAWIDSAFFSFDPSEGPLDARMRAMECAEHNEAGIFNSCQPDPRDAKEMERAT